MTTTHAPRPLTRTDAPRCTPGSWQVPVGPVNSPARSATTVRVELVTGGPATPTSTLLPAIALPAGSEQPVRLASVPRAAPRHGASSATGAGATSVAA